ncbi:hypothetical protein Enr13x_21600 [Stieleria neptunia]|uniref:Uncharacterized protein n=1 Tax=Stieleria neptunia TaxID=2527979 RepID=A0A518HN77_9BACT|nr:hypothetical protein Enr13x_21600 [Stieleria neptunia]
MGLSVMLICSGCVLTPERILPKPGAFTNPTHGKICYPKHFHGYELTSWNSLDSFGPVMMARCHTCNCLSCNCLPTGCVAAYPTTTDQSVEDVSTTDMPLRQSGDSMITIAVENASELPGPAHETNNEFRAALKHYSE